MRLNVFTLAETSELGNTGGLSAEQTALVNALTVTYTEINSLVGVTSSVQAQLDGKLSKAGGTMTGFGSVTAIPTAALHAVPKSYVDTVVASKATAYMDLTGGTMTGALTLSANAVSSLQAITKQQMEAAVTAAQGQTAGITGDLTVGFPRWNTAVNEQVGTGWATFQSKLQAIIAENRKAPLSSYAYVKAGGAYPEYVQGSGLPNFVGGVLMPDGRVYIVPQFSVTARIYDPVTDTLTTPSGTFPGMQAVLGGVLLKDGRVFCVPANNNTARIYDPTTDTLTVPGGTYNPTSISTAFWGGVLLPDGRVYCIPHLSTTARIYDPVSDTVTVPNGTFPGGSGNLGNGSHMMGTLLPSGKVFINPNAGFAPRIYDYVTDTLTVSSYVSADAAKSVLLPDGNLLLVTQTKLHIYNPNTDTATFATNIPLGSTGQDGCLTPDGRVFFYGNSSFSIYDPVTNVFSAINTGVGVNTNSYFGTVLLPDGRIFLVPQTSSTAAIAAACYPTLPDEIALSPFFNLL